MFVLILVVGFIALCGWFITYIVRDARRQKAAANAPAATSKPMIPTAVIGPTDAALKWTALDDHQLRRLLDSA